MKLLKAGIVCLVVLCASVGMGQETFFTDGGGDGLWQNNLNWSSGSVPTINDDVDIEETHTVDLGGGTGYGSTMSFARYTNMANIVVTNGSIVVGDGLDTFRISSSSGSVVRLYLDDITRTGSVTQDLSVANAQECVAEVYATTGHLVISRLRIGTSTDASGYVDLGNGVLDSYNFVSIGTGSGATGELRCAEFNNPTAYARDFSAGHSGANSRGTIIAPNGTVIGDECRIGTAAGAYGYVSMTNASLAFDNNIRVGDNTSATGYLAGAYLEQVLNSSRHFEIAASTASKGEVHIGEMDVTNYYFAVGTGTNGAEGILSWDAGKIVTTGFDVGRTNDGFTSTGTVTQNGGTNITQRLLIGVGGTYNLLGGQVMVVSNTAVFMGTNGVLSVGAGELIWSNGVDGVSQVDGWIGDGRVTTNGAGGEVVPAFTATNASIVSYGSEMTRLYREDLTTAVKLWSESVVITVTADPSSGSWDGGYQVTIGGGTIGNGSDITNVTLAGISATNIASQSATQVVVWAGSQPTPGVGDVVVYSTSEGATTVADGFTYTAAGLDVAGTNGAQVTSGGATAIASGTDFGTSVAGGPVVHTLSISNSGDEALMISGCSTSGAGAAAFSVTDYPNYVAVGGVSNLVLSFDSSTVGGYDAQVNFFSNDPDSPFQLNLAGGVYAASTNVGPYAGGNTITITNGTLGNGSDITNVTVGGSVATVTGQGTDWVTITVPAASSEGAKDIVIQSTSEGESLLANAYIYRGAGQIGGIVRDWTKWQDFAGLDEAIFGMGSTVYSNKLYSIGGLLGSTYITNVFCYDGDTWTEIAGLPEPRELLSANVYDGKLYAMGGKSSTAVHTNVYVFDGSSWSEVAGMPGIKQLFGSAVLNGYLYAIAGKTTAAGLTNVYQFDGATWTEVAGMPVSSLGIDAAVLNDRIYTCGSSKTNVYEFDGTNWTMAAGLPAARFAPKMANFDGGIYAAGGSSGSAKTNVYRFDGSSWTEEPGLPQKRQYFAFGVLDDMLHAVGGYNYAGKTNAWRYPYTEILAGTTPSSGVLAGGYQVVISGTNLCDGNISDVTSVTLCGVTAALDSVAGTTQIVVTADSRATPVTGDVVVDSVTYGTITGANRFSYIAPDISVLGTNGAVIADNEAASVVKGTEYELLKAGDNLTHVITITNTGSDTLTISSALVGSGAAQFDVSGVPTSLAAGATAAVSVDFSPSIGGSFSAALNITNNSYVAGNQSYVVNLSGRAYAMTTNNGPYAGGNSITITNGTLGNGSDITNVMIGGVVATVTGQGTSWVAITLPAAGSASAKDVVIQSTSEGQATLPNAYTYNPSGAIGSETIGSGVWTNMGVGFIGTIVKALAMMNGELYAAGNIHHSGSTEINNIAHWDGANWNALGDGLGDQAFGATAFGNTLYVGGEFTNAGSLAASRIAAWDGTSWTNLGNGLSGVCNGMDTDAAGNLYVNGGFATGVPSNRVAKWDGSAWSTMGLGFNNVGDAVLVTPDDSIYVSGGFTNNVNDGPYNVSMRYVAQWDGNNWTNMSVGMNQRAYTMASSLDSSTIYAGGVFSSAGGVAMPNVASWNGTAWTNVGLGVNSRVYAMATDDQDNLYVGGRMTTAGSVSNVGYVAMWNGTTWTNLGQGLGDYVAALNWSPQYGLVAGGEFTNTGSGVAANFVAQFDNRTVIAGGVTPDNGSYAGGFSVTIVGSNLCNGSMGDVTNVTLVGVSVASIDSISSTQIVVTADAGTPGNGDVVVYSTSYGITTKSNVFTYMTPDIGLLGTNGVAITNNEVASYSKGTAYDMLLAGDNASRTLSITNTGNATLGISGWGVSGPDAAVFTASGISSTVATGAVDTFTIDFAPVSAGSFSAVLTITNDAYSANSNFVINLTGSAYNISTNTGPSAGGNSVTISNSVMGSGTDITNVTVGGVSATITGQGTTWVTITLPAGSGTATIVVDSTSEGTITFPDLYTYNPAGQIGDPYVWDEVASMPYATDYQVAGAVGSDIVVAGGEIAVNGYYTNTYLFDGTNWNAAAGLPLAYTNIGYSVGGALLDELVFAGGLNFTDFSDMTNAYLFDGSSWSLEFSRHASGFGHCPKYGVWKRIVDSGWLFHR